MFVNNLSIYYYAFIGALILFSSLNSIAYGEELGETCKWSEWSDGNCINGYMQQTRTCICPELSYHDCLGDYSRNVSCKEEKPEDECCDWGDWEEWSECKDGYQSRVKNCNCESVSDSDYGSQSDSDSGSHSYTGSDSGSDSKQDNGKSDTGSDSKHDNGKSDSGSDSKHDNGKSDSGSDSKHDNGKSDSKHDSGKSDNYGANSGSDYGANSGSDYNKPIKAKLGSQKPEFNTTKCTGPQPLETRSCGVRKCAWSEWSEFTECSLTCGGGVKNRTRQCKCDTPDESYNPSSQSDSGSDSSYGSDSSSQSGSGTVSVVPPFNESACEGPSEESVPCNTQLCCFWEHSSLSTWTPCEGGVRRRYAMCICENNDYSSENPQSNDNSQCPEPQPFEEEECPVTPPCPDETTPCIWENWSEWTKCDKLINGVQFRRQLCTCPYIEETCSESYNDSLCIGAPLTETRSCNMTNDYGEDLCSFSWDFLDEWSPCLSENGVCGSGTQWRRQFCLDLDGNLNYDEDCVFTGEVPQFETRECTMERSCCEFSDLVPVECSSLSTSNPSVCVTPWSERSCICTEETESDQTDYEATVSNSIQCLWTLDTIDNPPIYFDGQKVFCNPTGSNYEEVITCHEFDSNSTCYTWTVNLDYENGEIKEVGERSLSKDSEKCTVPSCWDGWSEWSECAGTCEEAYQWRRQTTSMGLSACRQPPLYEYQSCNLTNCCEWIFDDSISWSNCSVLCGEGIQMRLPYRCSCGDHYLCPVPDFDFETRECQLDTECCEFKLQSEPTLCNLTCSQSWSTQKCVCGESKSTCDISNCYGVPKVNSLPCECVPPRTCQWRESVSECIPCLDDDKEGDHGITNNNDTNTDTNTDTDTDTYGSKPVVTDQCKGCLTLTRACYCDGVLSEESECPQIDLPLTDTLKCTLNCEWINESEWSPCEGGSQYLTRECSCPESENDVLTLDTSYSYSSLCNGFTRVVRSCNTKCLSAESWKTAAWPEEEDTKARTFPCSSLTWFELINLTERTPWEELAVEYIAAQLNILSGVSSDSLTAADLESAQSLLNECEWTSDQTEQAEGLLSPLQNFNTQ